MSSKKNKKSLIPKLRFLEFTEAGSWEQSTIGEVGSFYYGKSAPKWSLSDDAPTPCVRYGELYTKFGAIIDKIYSRTNIDPNNLRFSKGGEILVPRVGEVPEDFANCCFLPFPDIAIGEMISVYETKEYPIFYTYYFRTLRRQFAKVVEGQNVKNLYYVNLEPIPVGKPSIPEQKKIAECFLTLDTVITVQEKKVELLKGYKKGLMQRLFPREGQATPELRFSGFKGKWSQEHGNILFEQISNKQHNSTFPILAITQEHGAIPRDMIDYHVSVSEKSVEGYKVVEVGDFIISLRSFQGGIEYSNYKGICSPAYIILRKRDDLSGLYFKHFFKMVFTQSSDHRLRENPALDCCPG
ncbi:MAG: restriction endonuclease subunit S [Alphaproteobacteria bacterium]